MFHAPVKLQHVTIRIFSFYGIAGTRENANTTTANNSQEIGESVKMIGIATTERTTTKTETAKRNCRYTRERKHHDSKQFTGNWGVRQDDRDCDNRAHHDRNTNGKTEHKKGIKKGG
jgi:hypothetical protein